MNYLAFFKLVEEVKAEGVTEKTLQLWYVIYQWVVENGYADTADTPEFVSHVQSHRAISTKTINMHLARMAQYGLLKSYTLKRNLPKELRDELWHPFALFFSATSTLPTTFKRYSIPGKPCSGEFKALTRLIEKSESLIKRL